ncbi:MAG TPA: transporter substrate-binding domain-containing protein [Burkholderiales bacterium]|nr:transporter substrate-binding domain-containing protein [Burkholderiales bacterium]
MYRTLFILTLIAGLFALPQPASALKLLTEENPPLNYTENGKLTGMGTEVVKEMSQRANVPVKIEVMVWADAYKRVQTDKETCLYSTARLPNRELVFKWVGPIAVNKWGLFSKSGFSQPIKTLADVRPYRIGGVTRDAKTEYLKQKGITNIFEVADDKLNPPKLTLNRKEPQRIDLWITSVAGAKEIAAQAKAPDVKLVFLVRKVDSYLACNPRTSEATLKALSAALDEIKKDGTFKKIVDRYESR